MACVAVCMVSAVARWLRQATRNRMIEAITASTPIQKCRRKETTRNNGNQGTSNKRARHRAADRLANGLEVAHRLHGGIRIARHHPLEDLRREQRIDPHARPNQQPVADRVERRQGKETHGERDGDEQQGRLSARRHHAVIDLKHVDGGRKEQEVDEKTEYCGRDEVRAAGLDGLRHVLRQFDARNLHPAVLRLTQRQIIATFH